MHNIVTGGGGAGLYPLIELDAGSAQFWSRHHCVKVTVENEALRLRSPRLDRRSLRLDDDLSVPPTAATPHGSLSSPVIESGLADDNDGNLTGQRFDFAARSIPSVSGQFSNLGQVYVNNDRTHWYIGFSQAMIYPRTMFFFSLNRRVRLA